MEYFTPIQRAVYEFYAKNNTPQGMHYAAVIRALADKFSSSEVKFDTRPHSIDALFLGKQSRGSCRKEFYSRLLMEIMLALLLRSALFITWHNLKESIIHRTLRALVVHFLINGQIKTLTMDRGSHSCQGDNVSWSHDPCPAQSV